MNEVKRDKPKITIGTAGHTNHDKTSLTAAIIKLFSDVEENLKTHSVIEQKSAK